MFSEKTLIHCGGKLLDLSTPKVMGILNVTPDSFYPESRLMNEAEVLQLAEQMRQDGAAILDVGGLSTRPGAEEISVDEELHRVIPAIRKILKEFPDAIVSIDTFRSKVAEEAVAAGATMVNDISAGRLDADFLTTIAKLKIPYVLMHMQGTPQTMQENPSYESVVNDVFNFLKKRLIQLNRLGIHDIILDPGFGFGKSVEHNYQLLKHLSVLRTFGLPVLAGLSRKSMICKVLHANPANALNGTTALHAVALLQGAKILRVHDVKEAVETIELMAALHRA
ncbi:MAG: dihydropteroate synthase [Chitinophagales bacterium]|nr:dihydropteroate synthase [Chitinophagales bacterium]